MDRKAQALDFFDAWKRQDLDGVVDSFTEDAVYHNIPMDPIVGRDRIRETLAEWMPSLEGIDFLFDTIVVDGDRLLMERRDVVPGPAGGQDLPIMAIMEFRGDKIVAWREYFDLAMMQQAVALANERR